MASRLSATKLALRKPRRPSTPSTNRHRFEPFSQRISRLKINPLRRVREAQIDNSDTPTASYFQNALDEWVDRNLSEDFTDFAKQVYSISDSLPQIIHHEQKIIDLLLTYIEKRRTVALEPLLDLVAHFAHDLGVRFEKHFERTVSTVSTLAAQHQDVEVIEWSFNCLAWLFKYLSRLLVPDLRPVYDLIAPLLGRSRQKPFVARFAAEAISFLLRKAASHAKKDVRPLHLIVEHILDDVCAASHDKSDLYQQGLVVLFAESIQGSQGSLHSDGQVLFREILSVAFKPSYEALEPPAAISHVLDGVLITVLQHTDNKSSAPILDNILGAYQPDEIIEMNSGYKMLYVGLLLSIVAVDHGSKLAEWSPILDRIKALLSDASADTDLKKELLSTFAVAHQNCPLNIAISQVTFLELLASDRRWRPYFLSFCELYGELGKERFKDMILPHFKRFVVAHWQECKEQLCLAIPKFSSTGWLGKSKITLPRSWREEIVREFNERHAPSEPRGLTYYQNGLLELLRTTNVDSDTEWKAFGSLGSAAESVFEAAHSRPLECRDIFSAGNAFLHFASNGGDREMSTLQALLSATKHFKAYHIFWQAFLAYIGPNPPTMFFDWKNDGPIADLMDCLSCSDHSMRLLALQVLDCLETARWKQPSDILQIAISIATINPTVESIRTMTMHLRNLAKRYQDLEANSYLTKAIPSFCFGLLHVRLAPIWDTVCETLKEMCSRREGEEAICDIAFQWLEKAQDSNPRKDDYRQKPREGSSRSSLIPELERVQEQAENAFSYFESPEEQLKLIFDRMHARTSSSTSFDRTQALKVLGSIPESVEKKSRMLVPVLLNWTMDGDSTDAETSNDGSPGPMVGNEKRQHWSRKDQKAMLSLFGQFRNPKVLYKSAEVYAALLSLLSHGDVEIQRSALHAILTWKHPIISRYEEELMKFLDDAMFKEQLTIFLDPSGGDDSLQDEHRSEVLPIAFRLIYGKIINRSKGDQQSNRKTVFILLSRFREDEIEQFLGIILGRLSQLELVEDGILQENSFQQEILDQRKQLGLLNMLHDLLETLKSTASPFATQLVDPVIYCLIRAARDSVESTKKTEGNGNSKIGLARSVRQISLRCLIILFDIIPSYGWHPYLPTIYRDLVTPRVERLAQENAQAVSSLLRLFSVWARHAETVSFLSTFNSELIANLAACISNQSTKEIVRRFAVNEVFGSILDLAEDGHNSSASWSLINRHASVLLRQVGLALKIDSRKELLEDCVGIIVRLADVVPPSSPDLLSSLPFLLLQTSKKVSASAKTNVLRIILRAIPTGALADELFDQLYHSICSSFAYFPDRESRLLLCDILHELARKRSMLTSVANVCSDLNSYVPNRVNEPDFDRRSAAFSLLNEQMHTRLDAQQWQPLVHNMLFFVKDTEELAIRASATQSLRRFVDAAAHQWMDKRNAAADGDAAEESIPCTESNSFLTMLEKIVLPSIERGIRDQPELVRIEYLSIISYAVAQLPAWPPIKGMVTLLEPDDEASFFNNILHIQQHRRVRALKRLAEEVQAGHVASSSSAHFILPLVERFIFDAENRGEVGGGVSGEAVRTVAILLEGLDWNQHRSVMRRYIGDIKKREEMQEVVLRLVDGAASALSKCARKKFDTDGDVRMSEGDDRSANNGASPEQSKLQQTLPSREKLSTYLIDDVLPSLESFLRDKDEEVVSRRSRVAVTAARLLVLLPQADFEVRLPPVLLDTCNILRSKDPVSRDTARKALASMCQIIGPSSISFVLKALRSALQRGFHLHVLSYSVHSILTTTAPEFATGAFDHCVTDIITVIMDDIFGGTGQEKDEQEYLKDKASKKEVKQKKSFDSMQLVASTTSLPYLIELIRPLESLLVENLTQKMLRDVDELLRRIGLGLMQNAAVKDRDVLVFCHELTIDANKFAAGSSMSNVASKGSKYLDRQVQTTAHKQLIPQARVGKVVRFGLDLLRSVFRKQKDLATSANVSGFMPIIGDAVIDEQEELKLAAFRLFTQIINVPLPRIEEDAPVYVAEAVKVIESSEGTEREELPAAALKLIAAVLRVKPEVKVKDRVVALLLKQLKPDLQVKSQQGSAFTLLKAIVARKIVIPEVYELMDGDDGVTAISIRDHDRTTRDLARGVWYQFILKYPQAKGRFKKTLAFLTANLNYEHAEGRKAVLEALNLLLQGLPDDMVKEVISVADWSLVAVMVNDEDEECREMAAALVKNIILKADDKWGKAFLAKLRWMLGAENKIVLRRTALQCWALYLEEKSTVADIDDDLVETIELILNSETETKEEQYWELIFHALILFRMICEQNTKLDPFASDATPLWGFVRERLSYPHAWVKFECARLSGIFLKHHAQKSLGSLPASAVEGSEFSQEELRDLTKRHLRLLSHGISKDLANQVADNLSIIGSWFAAAGDVEWPWEEGEHELENNGVADEDDTGGEEENLGADGTQRPMAVDYLLHKLSKIIRRQPSKIRENHGRPLKRADSVIPKSAALHVVAKLVDTLQKNLLSTSAEIILQPLVHLNEGADAATYDATYNEAMQQLNSSALEVLDKLQKKLGTTKYVNALQAVKKGVKERRDERRTKRKIEAVAQPEKAERYKRKKQESLKARRKEKNSVARGHRRGW